MKSGQCPKCGSRDVCMKHRGIEAQGSNGMMISLSNMGSIAMYTHQAELDVYICTACGYLENYIGKPELLGKVASAWNKVGT